VATTGGAVTAKTAVSLVALPAALLTATVKRAPLSALVVTAVV
jgi:hypothetical protein